jgi:hypothetical protein
MSTDATTSSRFRVWIRRETDSEGPFSIRFEVEEGKGLLRVSRPGVLIDPPARPSGAESRLTSQQLRASRFLHVWDSGRSRQGYSLTRVDEDSLERAPGDRWVELLVREGSVLCYLSLPEAFPESDEDVEDEATSPREWEDAPSEDVAEASPRDPLRFAVPAVPPIVAELLPPAAERTIPSTPVEAQMGGVAVDATPSGPLVRHLRRQLARQSARILELEEEIRRLTPR